MRPILVTPGEVQQQVLDLANTPCTEQRSPFRADTLDELDIGIELEHNSGPFDRIV